MSRDYKKENEWLKENYKRFEIRVKKNVAEKFMEYLKEDEDYWSVNDWGNKQIEKYINKKEGIKMNKLTVSEIKDLTVEDLEKMMNEDQVNKMIEIGYNYRTMLDMLQESAEVSGQDDDEYHTSIDEYLDYLEEYFNRAND